MLSNEQIKQPLRVGIGGPVGSGKTALLDALCKCMRDEFNIAVVTNDIYTREDQQFLIHSGALVEDRILGVETGGCPHTAIREDASMNLSAVNELQQRFDNLDMIIIESGGDNLSATFSAELADLPIYVIDVSGGAAGTAGCMLTTANNKIIGFSLSGATIPPGEGILVLLNLVGSGVSCISSEENLIISDNSGNSGASSIGLI